ncbi:MAG TPA: mechanosensitive ion channel family protein [Gaiellaceae bacterium]|nr:mechanosensitive ion channel family protein [Gaiellaceae bacterium]
METGKDLAVLDPLIDLLNSRTPLYAPFGRLVVIAALFTLAWAVARSSGWAARQILAWHERRHSSGDLEATGKISNLKRRETLVSVIRGGITYVAFGSAIVLSMAQLAGGVDRLTAIAGLSFTLIVAGFAAQRILADVLAGLMMFVERWFSVGDTVTVHAGSELQGVVEDVSLRRTRLRSVTGEVIQINNSQIQAVKVLPRGVKELAIEIFVNEREAGERVVSEMTEILPEGPTTFIRRPWIDRVDELSHNLTRIRVHTSVAPGREWLAESFFADLLRQRASDSLIVHGPVVLAVDERATWSYARASGATRRSYTRDRGTPAGVL